MAFGLYPQQVLQAVATSCCLLLPPVAETLLCLYRTRESSHMCVFNIIQLRDAGWQSWLWYSLAKVVHVIPHVGDPLSDASRVLVSV